MAGLCLGLCILCILSALQLCLTQLRSEGALHAAHCGVILGLALLGFIIFCVCKEMHHRPGDHQAEVGGGTRCGLGSGAQREVVAVTGGGCGHPQPAPWGCPTPPAPSPGGSEGPMPCSQEVPWEACGSELGH